MNFIFSFLIFILKSMSHRFEELGDKIFYIIYILYNLYKAYGYCIKKQNEHTYKNREKEKHVLQSVFCLYR